MFPLLYEMLSAVPHRVDRLTTLFQDGDGLTREVEQELTLNEGEERISD